MIQSIVDPCLEQLGGANLVISIIVYGDNIFQYSDGH
jgi:hypothetical protein